MQIPIIDLESSLGDFSDKAIAQRQVFLYLSGFQHKGCKPDFQMRMQEQGAMLPGSVGEVVGQGFRRIADELSDVVDLVIQRNVTQSLQGAAEVATSADEPKGVPRVGLRFTFVQGASWT